MKGKVTIELKDVNTGEIEKIEGENLVTNALIKYANYSTLMAMYRNLKPRDYNLSSVEYTIDTY